jgi:hypothetical protein
MPDQEERLDEQPAMQPSVAAASLVGLIVLWGEH